MSELQTEQIEFLTHAAKNHLLNFAETINPLYESIWFHERIADALEDALQCAVAKKKKRIILSVPPRHGKSQLASIYFPAWALGKYPFLKFIISTYGADLSEKHGKETRDLIDSPAYKMIFPNTNLVQDMKARANWQVEWKNERGIVERSRKGQYYAVGVGGAVTGYGGDILIIDDPHKDRAEAESETMRNAVWNYYRSTLYSRKEGEGVIIVIMQRWSQDDLVGRLLDEDEKLREKGEPTEDWEVISLPAEAEEDEYYRGELVRKEGESLWKSKFTPEVLSSIKIQSLYYWASQWQQNPILAETAEFKKEMFKYYTDEEIKYKNLKYYTLVDPAISQKKSADNAVVLTVAKEIGGPNMYRIREDAGKFTPQQLVDLIFLHNSLYHGDVWIETIAYQEALKYMVQEKQRKDQVYFVIHEIKARSAKETRIRGLLGLYQNRVIWHRAGSDINYELELLSFPRGRHDDRADCMAFILMALEDAPSHSISARQFRPRWYGYGKKT